MFWVDIMTSFGPMCVVTSAIARFIPIFKLAYFWNLKTYTGEILIWCHTDGVLSEKHQNAHNINTLFFNGWLGWKFKNCWNDCMKYNYFWSIKNSSEVIKKLRLRNFQGSKVFCFDFSTLYTSLPHDLIKIKVLSLVNWCFNRESKSYLCTSLNAGF